MQALFVSGKINKYETSRLDLQVPFPNKKPLFFFFSQWPYHVCSNSVSEDVKIPTSDSHTQSQNSIQTNVTRTRHGPGNT